MVSTTVRHHHHHHYYYWIFNISTLLIFFLHIERVCSESMSCRFASLRPLNGICRFARVQQTICTVVSPDVSIPNYVLREEELKYELSYEQCEQRVLDQCRGLNASARLRYWDSGGTSGSGSGSVLKACEQAYQCKPRNACFGASDCVTSTRGLQCCFDLALLLSENCFYPPSSGSGDNNKNESALSYADIFARVKSIGLDVNKTNPLLKCLPDISYETHCTALYSGSSRLHPSTFTTTAFFMMVVAWFGTNAAADAATTFGTSRGKS